MSASWPQRFVLTVTALAFAASGHACELCRKAYYDALEAAPKASALHPDAHVVEYKLTIAEQTRASASADLRYLLTKQLSLTAGYSSDFGAGVGLLTRF